MHYKLSYARNQICMQKKYWMQYSIIEIVKYFLLDAKKGNLFNATLSMQESWSCMQKVAYLSNAILAKIYKKINARNAENQLANNTLLFGKFIPISQKKFQEKTIPGIHLSKFITYQTRRSSRPKHGHSNNISCSGTINMSFLFWSSCASGRPHKSFWRVYLRPWR